MPQAAGRMLVGGKERKKEREREVSRGLTAHKVWGDVAAMSIKEDLQEEGDAEGLLGAQ